MTQIFKAALVGCGSVSQRGVLPHLSLPDAKARIHLAAVVDAVAERAQQSAQKYGVPAWYTWPFGCRHVCQPQLPSWRWQSDRGWA